MLELREVDIGENRCGGGRSRSPSSRSSLDGLRRGGELTLRQHPDTNQVVCRAFFGQLELIQKLHILGNRVCG